LFPGNQFFFPPSQKLNINIKQVAQLSLRADRTALSGTAMYHAGDGYSTRRIFGGLVVHSMFLMYSPSSTNIYDVRGKKKR